MEEEKKNNHTFGVMSIHDDIPEPGSANISKAFAVVYGGSSGSTPIKTS